MTLIWTVCRCPVLGALGDELERIVLEKPEPWRSHALKCLRQDLIESSPTALILGLSLSGELIATTWLSLPKLDLPQSVPAYSFIFHVYVREDFRHRGVGGDVVKKAINLAGARGSKGILLATGEPKLRTDFYVPLGFRDHPVDEWLMVYDFEGVETLRNNERRDSGSFKPAVRSVTVHDLATIQSLCNVRRWRIQQDQAYMVEPEEAEESFCELCCDPAVDQFLIRGTIHNDPFLCWHISTGNKLRSEIVPGSISERDVLLANDNTIKALDWVSQFGLRYKTGSKEQLMKLLQS